MRYLLAVSLLLGSLSYTTAQERPNALACKNRDSLSRLAERAKESYEAGRRFYVFLNTTGQECWWMIIRPRPMYGKPLIRYESLAVEPNRRYSVDVVSMEDASGRPIFVAIEATQ